MRIINSQSGSARRFVSYNESKLERTLKDGSPMAIRLASSIDDTIKGPSQITSALTINDYKVPVRAIKRAVHFKIALHPNEQVSNLQMTLFARRTLQEFKMEDQPYVVYRHFDTKHPHIHIVVSRIKKNGKAISMSFDKFRQRSLSRQLETEFNLMKAEQQLVNDVGIRNSAYLELKIENKTQETSAKSYIQMAVQTSLANNPSEEIFYRRLARRNVSLSIRPYTPKKSKDTKYGISYSLINSPPRFVMPVRLDYHEAAYQYDYAPPIAPNGLEVYTGRSNLKFTNFIDFSVRASKLGPAFQFNTLFKNIPEQNVELRSKLTITANVDKTKKAEYYDLTKLIEKEDPAVSMLITAIEMKSEEGIQIAMQRGARTSQIDANEVKYLPEFALEYAKSIEKHYDPIISLDNKIEQLIENYKTQYGREPDELTKKLATDFVNENRPALIELTHDHPHFMIRKGISNKTPDVRILENVDLSHCSPGIKATLELLQYKFIKAAASISNLMTVAERTEYDNTNQFMMALKNSDYEQINEMINSNLKINYASIDHTEYTWEMDVFLFIESQTQKQIKFRCKALEMAIDRNDELGAMKIINKCPELLLEFNIDKLNFIQNDYNIEVINSHLEPDSEIQKKKNVRKYILQKELSRQQLENTKTKKDKTRKTDRSDRGMEM